MDALRIHINFYNHILKIAPSGVKGKLSSTSFSILGTFAERNFSILQRNFKHSSAFDSK